MSKQRTISLDDLPPQYRSPNGKVEHVTVPVGSSLDEVERELINRTIELTAGNKTLAARMLGLGVRTLYRRAWSVTPVAGWLALEMVSACCAVLDRDRKDAVLWQQVRCVRSKPEGREVEKLYRAVRRTRRQKSKLEPIATIFVARESAVGDGTGPLHQVRPFSGIDERA